jgi:putative ABC transport system permease protein
MTVLLCGVLPGFASTRLDVGQGLRLRSAGLEGGGRLARLRQFLTVAQIAASVILLVGAGLLVHSLVNLYRFDVGFDLDRVLAVRVTDSVTNRPPGQADRTLTELLTQIRRLAGVEAAGLAGLLPLTNDEIGVSVVPEGNPGQIDAPTHVFLNSVTPGYFETLGISVLAGRGCPIDLSPAALPAAIINRRLARHLFGETSALQRQVRTIEGARRMVIVGVVTDAIYTSVRETPRNFVYINQARPLHLHREPCRPRREPRRRGPHAI